MADVKDKKANFTSLLVYDVSHWGRFQDVDEIAYYEYVLKRAGIRVHYCAEQFENDGSMSSSVLKMLNEVAGGGGEEFGGAGGGVLYRRDGSGQDAAGASERTGSAEAT